ncbi:hypothetical protein ACHAWF_006364 [Thalassiosira exigua]
MGEVKDSCRDAIAEFIRDLAAAVDEAYWFSIRGHCQLALSTIMMLTVQEFASLILMAELVVTKKWSGSLKVETSDRKYWTPFLEDYGLRFLDGGSNIAEATKSQVLIDAFKRRPAGVPNSKKKKDMYLLRIGKYEKGVTTKASLQLRDCVPPPNLNRERKLRVAQRRLFLSVKPLIKDFVTAKNKDCIDAVVNWLEMKELEEDPAAYFSPQPKDKKSNNAQQGTPSTETEKVSLPTHEKNIMAKSPPELGMTCQKKSHGGMDCSAANEAFGPKVPVGDVRSPTDEDVPSRSIDWTKTFTGTEKDVTYKVPTPKAKQYSDSHEFSKFELLNSLNWDVMSRPTNDDDMPGKLSEDRFQNLLSEMFAFEEKHASGNKCITYSRGKFKYSALRVPFSKDQLEFHSRAKRDKWIEDMFESALEGEDINESIGSFCDYLWKYHNDAFRDKLVELGLCPKQMNEYEIAATMKAAGIGPACWLEIVKCLTTFTGLQREAYAKSIYSWQKLGEGHGPINSGTYRYYKDGDTSKRPEMVQWWTMDPVKELELRLTNFANEIPGFDPANIEYIHSLYSGDHGKEKLRFGSKLVVQMTGEKNRYTRVYPLGDAKCKKDNGDVFSNTLKPDLAAGINRVEKGQVKFQKTANGKWVCSLVDPPTDPAATPVAEVGVQDVTAYMVGDLKFLSMMLGKENFDGYWCYLCMLSIVEWAEVGHTPGELWTIDSLKRQAARSKSLSGIARRGVREEPYFLIPPRVLHTLIGVGNAVLDHLIDIVESEIQMIPAVELTLKREVRELKEEVKEMVREREYWDSSNLGSGKELRKEARRKRNGISNQMQILAEAGQFDGLDYARLYQEKRECDLEEERLNKERSKMTADIKKKREQISKRNEKLAEFRNARKRDVESLYTKIDGVLTKYKIRRQAYHGGDLTGGCVKKLMLYAYEIMEEVSALLLHEHTDECSLEVGEIKDLCTELGLLLTNWDGALQKLHTENPTEIDCSKAQEFIDRALSRTRKLGISVTVKGHGGESHLVAQMRSTPGGLFEFDESWTEQYHQTGYGFDTKLKNRGTELRKAETRAKNDQRENLPQTQEALKRMRDATTIGKSIATLEKEAKRKRQNAERREASLK